MKPKLESKSKIRENPILRGKPQRRDPEVIFLYMRIYTQVHFEPSRGETLRWD